MEEQDKSISTEDQLSEEQLEAVAGGAGDVHKQRLEHLDNQSKSVQDIQSERLDLLDNQTK